MASADLTDDSLAASWLVNLGALEAAMHVTEHQRQRFSSVVVQRSLRVTQIASHYFGTEL